RERYAQITGFSAETAIFVFGAGRSRGDQGRPPGGPPPGVRGGGRRPRAPAHGARAPAAHRPRPQARSDRLSRQELYTRFGADPYPLRVRIPLLPLSFTAFSHGSHRSLTDCALAPASLAAGRPN